jgi:hypothetical protein
MRRILARVRPHAPRYQTETSRADREKRHWRNNQMSEDAGYKYLTLLLAGGFYGINDNIENGWDVNHPTAAMDWMQFLEGHAWYIYERCDVQTYGLLSRICG